MIAATAILVSTAPLLAEDVPVSPGLPGWQELSFDNLAPNRWHEEDGALVVTSDASVSVLHRKVSVSLAQAPILRWRWRVDEAPPPTDLRQKGGDDRALSLTVGFAYDPAQATLGERMKRMVVEQMAGPDAPGRVIAMTWGGTTPQGSLHKSPYTGDSGGILIMRPPGARTGQWIEESIDLAALYRRLWGAEPPDAVQIAITADSDDTRSRARARIRDIRFTAH